MYFNNFVRKSSAVGTLTSPVGPAAPSGGGPGCCPLASTGCADEATRNSPAGGDAARLFGMSVGVLAESRFLMSASVMTLRLSAATAEPPIEAADYVSALIEKYSRNTVRDMGR